MAGKGGERVLLVSAVVRVLDLSLVLYYWGLGML